MLLVQKMACRITVMADTSKIIALKIFFMAVYFEVDVFRLGETNTSLADL